MDESNDRHAIVFRSTHRKASMDSQLVLESAGIPSEVIQVDGSWAVVVHTRNRPDTIDELDAYRRDASSEPSTTVTRTQVFGGAFAGVCC